MSTFIHHELFLMIQAAATGAVLLFCYSILRGLRRIWHHSAFFTGAEDLLYWLASALWVFARVYRNNDGILRLFMVPGMIAGALLCHFFLEKMIKWLLFPVRRCKLSLYKHIKKGRMAHWVILRRKKEKRNIEDEQARTEEIDKLKRYMETDEYAEEVARERLGLVKDNETVFKKEQ